MSGRQVTCPSCGAQRELANPASQSFRCEYCGSVVVVDDKGLADRGKQAQLGEGFTRLFTGATGEWKGHRFRVLGRVRYAYDRGFWDEWCLELVDGGTSWMTEDDHELCVQEKVDFPFDASADSYQVGQKFTFQDEVYRVEEVGEARCLGLEGELPKEIEPDESYPFVDASSCDGRFALGLEFDAEPPTAYVGRWLTHGAVALDDEGDDW